MPRTLISETEKNTPKLLKHLRVNSNLRFLECWTKTFVSRWLQSGVYIRQQTLERTLLPSLPA
jgi:hypothetical protein